MAHRKWYNVGMPSRRVAAILLCSVLILAGCSRPAPLFSESNARAHVQMLAGTIGCRPTGTEANARARAYVIDQLRLFGFDVRVQETDARRPELGRTARVSNIIGVLQGSRREAVGLVSHYDSSPYAPGGADDGLGVAVSLEAARVFAARKDRTWSLLVLVTDAEEYGLLGAAALDNDRDVTSRLNAYINLEAVGSGGGAALLFETGPANAWLVKPWARRAPRPRGASYSLEVYRRLPNDTDFSILKRQDIPGLNFAAFGDSYAYHTARDTADRLSPGTLRATGENVVGILEGLEESDITRRSGDVPTFFDIASVSAVTYGRITALVLTTAALLFGVVSWVRVTTLVLRAGGALRWFVAFVWTAAGVGAAVASMVAVTWALRAAREVYHPWYARPGRLLALLVITGASAAWAVSRAGLWLPPRVHLWRHPATTWSITLPWWIALSLAALWYAPAASYLWTLPLLTASMVVLPLPVDPTRRLSSPALLRAGSILVLAVSATLWLRDTTDLFHFVVAMFGRLPIITPIYVYAALIAAAGVMIAPPLVAAVAGDRPLGYPRIATVACLVAIATAATAAYRAPAYTAEQPLRRYARALQEADGTSAIWEVGSTEPGLDLETGAPPGWVPTGGAASQASVPWGTLPYPFVFRTTASPLGPAPVEIAGFTVEPAGEGVELSVTVVPKQGGLALSFVLPAGVSPARSSLPGVLRLGRWTATYVAPAPDGVAWRASFGAADAERLRDTRVVVTDPGFPGGTGWQRLPAWLPQEHAVWTANATWAVPAATGPAVPGGGDIPRQLR